MWQLWTTLRFLVLSIHIPLCFTALCWIWWERFICRVGRDRSPLSHNFFSLRVINYHANLCSAAAAHFYFRSTGVPRSAHIGPPHHPLFQQPFRTLFIIPPLSGWRRERGTVWQGWGTWAGKHACPELSSHCCWKERAGKLAANTRTQTRQAHSTSIPSRGVCEQPHSSYLAGLGSLCSAAPSAPRALFPPGAAGPGLWPGAGAGRGWQQLAAASAAGLWLLPGLLLLLLLLMMPRRRRAEWGGGGCWRWCCCHGYPTRRRHRSEQQLPQHPDLLQPMAAKQPSVCRHRVVTPEPLSIGKEAARRMEVTPRHGFGALGKQMEWCIQNVFMLHLSAESSVPCKGQTPASRRNKFSFFRGFLHFYKELNKTARLRKGMTFKVAAVIQF